MECRSKIADILIQKSVELSIDLNAKDSLNDTAFHLACMDANSKIAEILIQKSDEFDIELNAKDADGLTAFHSACREGQ